MEAKVGYSIVFILTRNIMSTRKTYIRRITEYSVKYTLVRVIAVSYTHLIRIKFEVHGV